MSNVNELLRKSLTEIQSLKADNRRLKQQSGEAVAIVGVSCRYPGGIERIDQLWQALAEGRDCIGTMTDQRWDMSQFLSSNMTEPGTIYTDAMGMLEHIDGFDAELFGLKGEELIHIDPQHRLLMELAWEAFEDAGLPSKSLQGTKTGVYVGLMSDDYGQLQGPLDKANYYIGSGNAKSCAAGRLSFTFGLQGPSVALDTACSSSLVGVHLAVSALRRGECDAALAGGVNLILSPQGTVVACRSQMLSKTGRCHTFDADADGYVRAEGGGLVMLKRLSDAEADGDRIYALIRGSAVNHDGRSQGLTAPNGQAQRRVIQAALADAGKTPEQIGFVECHGTGTSLGDPVEIRALHASYVAPCAGREPIRIGAIKTNLGHMESAAGIGGLHKTIEILRHRQVPPSLHFNKLNPHISVDMAKIDIATDLTELAADDTLCAAVSSFGFSGTNAHIVLERYQAPEKAAHKAPVKAEPSNLFRLSGQSHQAVLAAIGKYVESFEQWQHHPVADVCLSASTGRNDGPYRIAFTVNDAEDILACLEEYREVTEAEEWLEEKTPQPLLWAFAGTVQPSLAEAGQVLARYGAYRRAALEAADKIRAGYAQVEVHFNSWSKGNSCEAEPRQLMVLNAIHQYALARMLFDFGVKPQRVTGFGYAEAVAAAAVGELEVGAVLEVILSGQGNLSRQSYPRASFHYHRGVEADWQHFEAAQAAIDDSVVEQLGAEMVAEHETLDNALCVRFDGMVKLQLPDAIEDQFFYWVHGDTNREASRSVENLLASAYMAGCAIDWAQVYAGQPADKVALPTYPFQRKSYWTGYGYSFDPSVHSGVAADGRRLRSSGTALVKQAIPEIAAEMAHPLIAGGFTAPGGNHSYFGEIDPARMAFLLDHRVFDEVLVPASVFIDLILFVGAKAVGERVEIEQLNMLSKCVLASEKIFVYCELSATKDLVDIYTRTQGQDSWHKNAQAVIGKANSAGQSVDLTVYQQLCQRKVSVKALYLQSLNDGIDYGERFRGISMLSGGGNCALGKIALPRSVAGGVEDYLAHPVLLDSCLQMIAAADQSESDELFVPSTITGINVFRPLPEAFWCFVEVSNSGGADGQNGAFCAKLTLLDNSNEVLATIDRFETVKYGKAPVRRELTAGTEFKDWVFEKHWLSVTGEQCYTTPFAPFEQLLGAGRQWFNQARAADDFERYRAYNAVNGRLACAYIVEALRTFGLGSGDILNADGLIERHGVLPRHRGLIGRLCQILFEQGCAEPCAEGYRLNDKIGSWSPSADIELQMNADAGGEDLELAFFSRFGRVLPGLLTGSEDPLALMFEHDKAKSTEGVYQQAEGATLLNRLVAQISRFAIDAQKSGRTIRLLEIGAGTGGTTAHILPHIAGLNIEYTFTDISQHFLNQAAEKFSEYDFIRYQLLDIDAEPQTQPLSGQYFDIVIAVNVLHATPSLARTLRHVNHYSASGALLLIKELTIAQPWVDLTFGMTPGWWAFTDTELRQGGPLLDCLQWQSLLNQCGFEAGIANAERSEPEALAQIPEAIVVGKKCRQATDAKHFVLLSDEGALCGALTQTLQKRGDSVSVVNQNGHGIAGSEDLEALLERLEKDSGAIDGVIYGWTLQPFDVTCVDNLNDELERYAKYPLWLSQLALQTRWRHLELTFLTCEAQPIVSGTVTNPMAALVWGHVNSFVNENDRYCRVIDVGADNVDSLLQDAEHLAYELDYRTESQIGIRGSDHYIARLERAVLEPTLPPTLPQSVKADASYLITGGFGDLGIETARELAEQGARHVILLGRNPDKGENNQTLAKLKADGVSIYALKADTSDYQSLSSALAEVLATAPPLKGVIHSVGVLEDGVVAQQSWARYLKVLGPKVCGTLYLHQLTQEMALDFFILYSSAAAILGNPGQANHAAANTFMDSFCWFRRDKGLPGLSINWGGWSEIGAAAGYAKEGKLAREDSLVGFISPEQGCKVIERIFSSAKAQFALIPLRMNLQGRSDQMPYLQKLLANLAPTESVASEQGSAKAAVADGALVLMQLIQVEGAARTRRLGQYLANLIGGLLNTSGDIDRQASLFDIGLDSLLSIDLRTQLEKDLDCKLPSTVLHDNPSIESLTAYLENDVLKDALASVKVRSGEEPKAAPVAPAPEPVKAPVSVASAAHSPVAAVSSAKPAAAPEGGACQREMSGDIAIIGVTGRYPKADTIDKFWANLSQGVDAVGEVPSERWDHNLYFDENKGVAGKSYTRYGAFIDDVDKFDALFFKLPPRMADLIDPKERLFLQTVWSLLDNAGYTRASLKAVSGGSVGVYVGAMYQLYSALAEDPAERSATMLNSFNSIANRVSHHFDFNGPSMAVDTMCSSSMTAVDLACQALRRGDCQVAVAGGINLSIHPQKFVGLCEAQLAASHIGSRAFAAGDGFIPAEAVGAVLLKPLARAQADEDNILALIKSTLVGHNGHSNGFHAPNGEAQVKLLKDNFAKAGIEPAAVSYIEAAANGTSLADIAEIKALSQVFGGASAVIGSVKSNLGHPEAASGIAQLTKVICQLGNRRLVPSIHVDSLNPGIDFDQTPFSLNRELREWPQSANARVASISSFGAGGTNAHMIVAEYPQAVSPQGGAQGPELIVLSAYDQAALNRQVLALYDFLRVNLPQYDSEADEAASFYPCELSLANVAHTLQVGREAMDQRLALAVADFDELMAALSSLLDKADIEHRQVAPKGTILPQLHQGNVAENSAVKALLSGPAGEAMLAVFIKENDLDKIALHFTQGGDIPWQSLRGEQPVRRVMLPGYCFAPERHWLHSDTGAKPTQPSGGGAPGIQSSTPDSGDNTSPVEKISAFLQQVLVSELNYPKGAVKPHSEFADLGIDSVLTAALAQIVEQIYQVKLSARDFYEHSSIVAIARHIAGLDEKKKS